MNAPIIDQSFVHVQPGLVHQRIGNDQTESGSRWQSHPCRPDTAVDSATVLSPLRGFQFQLPANRELPLTAPSCHPSGIGDSPCIGPNGRNFATDKRNVNRHNKVLNVRASVYILTPEHSRGAATAHCRRRQPPVAVLTQIEVPKGRQKVSAHSRGAATAIRAITPSGFQMF